MNCPICSSVNFKAYPDLYNFCRITSDGKPFTKGISIHQCLSCGSVYKPVTDNLLQELTDIYSSYDIFSLTEAEQQIFDPSSGQGMTRSEKILRYVFSNYDTASLLDYGCGKGFLLEKAYQLHPELDVYGLEQNQRNASIYDKIDGLKEVFYVMPERNFDVITLIHVLEHFIDPIASLREIQTMMSDDSILVINVPNAEKNPFDFAVADHISHFNQSTLELLLQASGLQIVEIMTDFIKKEIIAICKLGSSSGLRNTSFSIDSQLEWISALGKMGVELSEKEPINIFGSSQAAIWVASNLKEESVNCFVDEDQTKVGKRLFNKPIISPSSVNSQYKTLMCLPSHIAHMIQERLQLPNCVMPPQ